MTRAQRIQAIDHAIAKEERLKLRALRAKNFAVARNHEKKILQLQLQRAHLVHPGQGPGKSRAPGQGPGKSRHPAAHPGDPKANIPITVKNAREMAAYYKAKLRNILLTPTARSYYMRRLKAANAAMRKAQHIQRLRAMARKAREQATASGRNMQAARQFTQSAENLEARATEAERWTPEPENVYVAPRAGDNDVDAGTDGDSIIATRAPDAADAPDTETDVAKPPTPAGTDAFYKKPLFWIVVLGAGAAAYFVKGKGGTKIFIAGKKARIGGKHRTSVKRPRSSKSSRSTSGTFTI